MLERIILVLSLSCIVILPVVFLTRYAIGRKIWRWPKGVRVTGTHMGFTAHFIHKDVVLEFSPEETARRAAFAAWCLEEVIGKAVVPREFVVHVLDDRTYEKTYDGKIKTNGRLVQMRRKVGSEEMNLVACRGSTFYTTPTTGSLVVHELLHASVGKTDFADYGDYHDRDHSDPRVWGGTPTSIEGKSFALFVKLVR